MPRTTHAFCPGYAKAPYKKLVQSYPGDDVYPTHDFRTEWGPIFHRGRLDGTARVLVIGQDPAAHEAYVRRILVGEAGQRMQGFLARLGIDRSYVLINTFLYSVYGQGGGNKHKADTQIAAYRNRWLKAILAPGKIDAVVALGSLATAAWEAWTASPDGSGSSPKFVHITHPTQPEATAGNNAGKHAAAIKAMLENWNTGLQHLHPLPHPDHATPLK